MAYTTIDKPTDHFNTKLYTGTGSSHAVSGIGFQPDWVWIKCRDDSHNHQVFDVVRGVHKRMRTDTDGAETESSESLKSFDSDGFTLGTQANVNASASGDNSFVSWNWLAGGSASSNTDGDITSSVSANTTAGFSIVSYTATGSGTTVGHGLGAIPKAYFLKNRASASWVCYFEAIGNTKFLQLDLTNAAGTASEAFNDTSPTSSVFSVGSDTTGNANSNNYIAYVFAEKQGYSKIGSYTGNGNANGTFVYTGFRPAWILLKQSSTSGAGWRIHDNKRGISGNPEDETLYASANNAESTGRDVDFLSNGFKLRTDSGDGNSSGSTYIYMAFAESPFVNSNGVPCNAR